MASVWTQAPPAVKCPSSHLHKPTALLLIGSQRPPTPADPCLNRFSSVMVQQLVRKRSRQPLATVTQSSVSHDSRHRLIVVMRCMSPTRSCAACWVKARARLKHFWHKCMRWRYSASPMSMKCQVVLILQALLGSQTSSNTWSTWR